MTQEDFLHEIEERQSAIRDLQNDISLLIKAYVLDRNLTSQETADYLRCDVKQIPSDIPRTMVTRTKALYKLSTINGWLKSRTKKNKKEELF